MTAATVEASCSATIRSSSSARSARMLRLAAREAVLGRQMGVRHVVDARVRSVPNILPVGDDAAHRDAAEIDAVIAALAADQPGAAALALHALVGERDLQRGVDGFGAGIGEEDMVPCLPAPHRPDDWRVRRPIGCPIWNAGA